MKRIILIVGIQLLLVPAVFGASTPKKKAIFNSESRGFGGIAQNINDQPAVRQETTKKIATSTGIEREKVAPMIVAVQTVDILTDKDVKEDHVKQALRKSLIDKHGSIRPQDEERLDDACTHIMKARKASNPQVSLEHKIEAAIRIMELELEKILN